MCGPSLCGACLYNYVLLRHVSTHVGQSHVTDVGLLDSAGRPIGTAEWFVLSLLLMYRECFGFFSWFL